MRLSVRPIRILSLLVLIAVTNVFVFAGGATSSSGTTVLSGKLVTTSNRPIIVNGGAAITGSIILSGAQIATPAASFATVQVDRLGTVTVAPLSIVTLNYDAKSITVAIASGDATISTAPGVKGLVIGANKVAVPAGSMPAPAGGNTAKNWGIAGVAVGSAAFIWAIIAWNRANDARDDAAAAAAANAALAAQLAALRTCLAGQTASPVKLCTSF
jgi:hypothetical protein